MLEQELRQSRETLASAVQKAHQETHDALRSSAIEQRERLLEDKSRELDQAREQWERESQALIESLQAGPERSALELANRVRQEAERHSMRRLRALQDTAREERKALGVTLAAKDRALLQLQAEMHA